MVTGQGQQCTNIYNTLDGPRTLENKLSIKFAQLPGYYEAYKSPQGLRCRPRAVSHRHRRRRRRHACQRAVANFRLSDCMYSNSSDKTFI